MASCRSLVKHYENISVQQLTESWNQVYKKGPSLDILREILMFYFHHKHIPPVMQKSCDTLLSSVYSKDVSKKQKNIIFQIVEEVSVCLESSIVEQITFSSHNKVPTELLNCILVGGLVPLLDEVTVEKLCSFLRNSDIPVDERGKILFFLHGVYETLPTLISLENMSRLGILMEGWCRYVQNKSVTSSLGLFGRSDTNVATEVDGTPAGEIFTVLTLANNFSDHHFMGIRCFSTIRDWLGRKMIHQSRKLPESVREYCSIVVEQCLKPARKDHDGALQKAVLCEVLDIMIQLVQLDATQATHCMIVVKRIQNSVKEHFRGDYRDICIFVRVLTFLFNFGESTGYNSQLTCEHFLNDMVYRSYNSGLAGLEIIIFLVENKHKIAALQKPLLERFFPNILKIVACHPCAVIEESIELMPAFTSPDTAVEVFHSIIDLPLLSATLCLHQAPSLAQQDSAGSLDASWASLLSCARSLEYQHTFSYMMRIESGQKCLLDRLPTYMKLLEDISNHSLVVTCSQIVPLLLEAYFHIVAKWTDVSCVAPVVLAMFSRMVLLYNVPDYAASISKCTLQHFKRLFKTCPGLIVAIQDQLIEYISAVKNYSVFPQLYIHVVHVIGEYPFICDRDNVNQSQISQYYEVLECLIYEILAQIATSEPACLQLLNVVCSALAKLATKCQDQIPRAVLCLNKIRLQFSSQLPSEEQLIMHDRMEELLCLLQNPNVAHMVWSSTQSHNMSVTSFVQVLAQITDT